MEHNENNCEALATRVVDAWDLEGLVDFARETLKQQYLADQAQFASDAADFFRDEDAAEDESEGEAPQTV